MYAHASEGCLHVRPVLNLKLDKDVKAMRAIAEEAFAMVRDYKGSHSGEHGDGIVRSEFHEPMFGSRLVRAFERGEGPLRSPGRAQSGKIVRRAEAWTTARCSAIRPDYRRRRAARRRSTGPRIPEPAGGFQGAVEMCNNNGACRKLEGGVMCPSYRATRNEKDVTRGRANTLRLAISGQLGPDALTSDEMMETLKLCVSCKGCRRECPTGVDMAKMKIEVLGRARRQVRPVVCATGWSATCRAMPAIAARFAPLVNLRNRSRALRRLLERVRRHQRAPRAARVAARRVRAAARSVRPGERPRGRALRRHVQPHL